MNRPKLVRDFYHELRQTAGDLASSSELLQAASELADAFASVEQGRDRVMSFRTGGVPFDRWSVDRAMADGGWRVLRHERELAQSIYEDEINPVWDDIAVKTWMTEHAA